MEIRARDGTMLHAEQAGEGRPVVLIHAAAAAGIGWGPVFDELARAFRVVRYDRRAYGASQGDPTPDNQVHAADAAAVIRATEAAPATVVGWSRGGAAALELALAEPELVERLVLVEPAFEAPRHISARMARTVVGFYARRRFDRRGAVDRLMRAADARRHGPSPWDEQEFGEEGRDRVLANTRAIIGEWGLRQPDKLSRQRVGRLEVPVTVLLGEQTDPWFEGMATALVEVLPRGRLVRVPGATHAFVHTGADGIVAAVLEAAPAPAP